MLWALPLALAASAWSLECSAAEEKTADSLEVLGKIFVLSDGAMAKQAGGRLDSRPVPGAPGAHPNVMLWDELKLKGPLPSSTVQSATISINPVNPGR